MNRLRITDFSNPYSPTNKVIVTKFNKTAHLSKDTPKDTPKDALAGRPKKIKDHSDRTRNHSPLGTPSVSPRLGIPSVSPRRGATQIAELTCMDEYRRMNKIKLGKEKITKIT